MPCINCFFSNKYQRDLKQKTFHLDRFEQRLSEYKKLFLNELSSLSCVNECTCNYKFNGAEYTNWTSKFLDALKAKKDIFENTFDSLILVYYTFIKEDSTKAQSVLWNFLQDNNIHYGTEEPQMFQHLLFRARPKGSWNKFDPNEYFHIPFNQRYKVGNQRFSSSGQPMLYLGGSILAVTKELSKEMKDLNIAAYLPKYNQICNKRFFDLKNNIFSILVKNLHVNVSLDYFPKDETINEIIKKTVLMEIATFQTKETLCKKDFVEEYVIPQVITKILQQKGFCGLVFESTKDYSSLTGEHFFSDYNYNYCFFTNYSYESNYDEDLKKLFHIFILDKDEDYLNETIENINKLVEKCIDKNKASSENNNNYITPICLEQQYLDYLQTAYLNEKKVYESDEGRLHLKFTKKMVEKMYGFIR